MSYNYWDDEMEKFIAKMALDITMREMQKWEKEKRTNQIKTFVNNLLSPRQTQINGLTAGAYQDRPAGGSTASSLKGFNDTETTPVFELEISKNAAPNTANTPLAPVPKTVQDTKPAGYSAPEPKLHAKTDINQYIQTNGSTLQNNVPQTTKPANPAGSIINWNAIQSKLPMNNNKNKIDLRLPDFNTDKAKDFSKSINNLQDKAMSSLLKTLGKSLTNVTAREYYGLSANLGDNEKPTRKMRKTNDFYKLKDIGRQDLHRLLAEKIAKAENLDINNPDDYKKIEDFDIVVPKNNSKLAAIIQKSPKMEEFIRQNYDKIKNGDFQKSVQSIEFPYEGLKEFRKLKELRSPGGLNDIHIQEDLDKFNLFATIHRADLYDMKINPDGSLTYILNDHYDFDPAEHDENKSMLYNLVMDANNIAVEQLKNKEIRPYQILRPVTIPKEELIRILQGL